jgi:hypothetical protein
MQAQPKDFGHPSPPTFTVCVQTPPPGQSPPHVPSGSMPHGSSGPTHWQESPSGVTHALPFPQYPLQEVGLPPQKLTMIVVVVIDGHTSEVVVVVVVVLVVMMKVTVVETDVTVVTTLDVTVDVTVVVTMLDVLVEEPDTLVEVVPAGNVVEVVPVANVVEVVPIGLVVVTIGNMVVVVMLVVVVVDPSQHRPSIAGSTWTSRRLHAVRTLSAPFSVPSFLK